jgi:hypothetical protein
MPRPQRKDWPARFKVFPFNCTVCGEESWANKRTAKFCSTTCRVHAWDEKQEKSEETQKTISQKDEVAKPKSQPANIHKRPGSNHSVLSETYAAEKPQTIQNHHDPNVKDIEQSDDLHSLITPKHNFPPEETVWVRWYGQFIPIKRKDLAEHFQEERKRMEWRKRSAEFNYKSS